MFSWPLGGLALENCTSGHAFLFSFIRRTTNSKLAAQSKTQLHRRKTRTARLLALGPFILYPMSHANTVTPASIPEKVFYAKTPPASPSIAY